MSLIFKEIATATMVLFAVIDIIGAIPVIIDIRKHAGQIQAFKASLVSLILMVAFLFVGESILQLIGIDVKSFAVAGSFILFFLALEMVLGIKLYRDQTPATASIVPLAFPIIAGAGTMTSLVSLQAEFRPENIVVAIVINILVVYAVLRSTKKLEQWLGDTGIAVIRKVFGIILLAIAVKLFKENIGL